MVEEKISMAHGRLWGFWDPLKAGKEHTPLEEPSEGIVIVEVRAGHLSSSHVNFASRYERDMDLLSFLTKHVSPTLENHSS
jgi:hypothetical protein